jgi:hypothetical protein
MSMQITFWGDNGRMRVDRQEMQVYLRDELSSFPNFRRGWNTRLTTELTDRVWFYLRGEEYSMQIDHFARCIKDPTQAHVSSFETAVETDRVLAKIIADASETSENQNRIHAQAPRKVPLRKRGIAQSLKGLLRHDQFR